MEPEQPKAGNTVGEKLLAYLKVDERSIRWLASRAGVKYRTLWGLINQDSLPARHNRQLEKVCPILKITIDDLFPTIETASDPLALPLEMIDAIETKTRQLRGAISVSLNQLSKQDKFELPLINGTAQVSKLLSECEQGVTVQCVEIPKGTAISPHDHPGDLWIVILKGRCILEMRAETIGLELNSTTHIPPEAVHRFNPMPTDVVMLVITIGENNEVCGA